MSSVTLLHNGRWNIGRWICWVPYPYPCFFLKRWLFYTYIKKKKKSVYLVSVTVSFRVLPHVVPWDILQSAICSLLSKVKFEVPSVVTFGSFLVRNTLLEYSAVYFLVLPLHMTLRLECSIPALAQVAYWIMRLSSHFHRHFINLP